MKTKMIKATWTVNIQIPMVPNFFLELADNTPETERGKYPITDFPDSVLREVGAAWTEKLIESAHKKRSFAR